ncbi:MAG: hypothetical protein PUB52_08245 [Lachnospiraceae bacterium]|nr:hypothetical protein [Lachnospiraceae bacterium]MDD6505019.1 hypothetical protein [Lachnospiraceae bacterium]
MREITCIQLLIEFGPVNYEGAIVWMPSKGNGDIRKCEEVISAF